MAVNDCLERIPKICSTFVDIVSCMVLNLIRVALGRDHAGGNNGHIIVHMSILKVHD
jgi:hypothetical protein